MQEPTEKSETRLPQEGASAEHVSALKAALEGHDAAAVLALTKGLKAPDLADLIELLQPDERIAAGADCWAPTSIPRCSPRSTGPCATSCPRRCPTRSSPRPWPSSTLTTPPMSSRASKRPTSRTCSRSIPSGDRAALERNLEYPEETAGRLMQTDFVAVPPFWTVGQVIDHMREADDLPETFSDIFVVDPTYRVMGSVDLSRLLRTQRAVGIAAIMDRERQAVLATADQEEVGAPIRALRPEVGARRRREQATRRRRHRRRRGGGHRGGDGGGLSLPRRRRRRKSGRHRVADRQEPLPLAAGQSRDRGARVLGHQDVRRLDRADGGAGRADADRRLDGRQRRYPDDDSRRARARHTRPRPRQHRPHHSARSLGRADQRDPVRGHPGRRRVLLVRLRARLASSSAPP